MTQRVEVLLHGVVDGVIVVIPVSHSVPLCTWRGGEWRALRMPLDKDAPECQARRCKTGSVAQARGGGAFGNVASNVAILLAASARHRLGI